MAVRFLDDVIIDVSRTPSPRRPAPPARSGWESWQEPLLHCNVRHSEAVRLATRLTRRIQQAAHGIAEALAKSGAWAFTDSRFARSGPRQRTGQILHV